MVFINNKVLRAVTAVFLAFGSLFWAAPSNATGMTLEQAQAALVLAQEEVASASAALELANEAVASASAEVTRTLEERNATATVIPGTSSTTVQNVVQNGTFDSTAGWSNVMASNTVYGTGASPLIYNGTLKGSYTAGIYIQQTGTFPAPTRQVQFSVDVWNYDTNEGNRINNPDYYRIEFRTYDAAGNRLNYYNLEWSQWHNYWITRGATYTLDTDAVRWDIGFRMADAGFWAGAFGPVMDNVQLIATMTTSTPDQTTYDPDKQAAYDAAVDAYNQAVLEQQAAQNRLTAANAEVDRLQQLILDLTPTLNAPTNLQATLTDSSVVLTWDAPATHSSGVAVERYAIMWSTTNFTQNGWGWAHDQTSVSIPLSVLASAGGLGNEFQFAIRADNDTQSIYSQRSNIVSIQTVAPPWWQIQFNENDIVSIGAPSGYVFSNPTAWYGTSDGTCGLDVSSTVSSIIYGNATASFVANNDTFTDPCPGWGKVLRLSTPIMPATISPEPTPSPTESAGPTNTPEPSPGPTQPEPTPTPEPSPEPSSTPTPTTPNPQPEPSIPDPEPTSTPVETPVIIEPTPTPTEEPTVDPEPTPEPEPQPTVPSEEEPTPEPSPSEEPTKEPEEVKPTPLPEPEPSETPEPREPELSVEESVEIIEEISSVDPSELSDEQVEQIVEAAMVVFETAEQGSEEYEAALDALMVAAQADDMEVPEELAAIPLIGDVAGAAIEVFNSIGNLGADMSPQVRETSEKVIVASVIVGQVAMAATTAAATSAAMAARRP